MPYKTPKYKKSDSVLLKKGQFSSDEDAQQGSIHIDEEEDHIDKGPAIVPGSIFNCLENKISMTHSTIKTKQHKIHGVPGILHLNAHKKHHWTSEWLDSCKLDLADTHKLRTDSVKVNRVKQKSQETCSRSSVVNNDVIVKHKPEAQSLTAPDGSHSQCAEQGQDTQFTHSTVMLEKCNQTNGMHADSCEVDSPGYKPGISGNTAQKAEDCKRVNNVATDTSTHVKDLHVDVTVLTGDTKSGAQKFTSIQLHQEDRKIAQIALQNICTNEGNVERVNNHGPDEHEEICSKHGHQGKQEDTSQIKDEYIGKKGDLYEWPEDQPVTNDDKQQRTELHKQLTSRKSASTMKTQNLNENFVKLELKKKRYTRKGLFHIKGEAYKRQVWKQMMQKQEGGLGLGNRGRHGGWRGGRGRGRGSMNMANPADKCFKCGQTGHWASTCYGQSQENEKKEIKEEDFPTLEEASLAARGIKTTTGECDGTPSEEYIPEVSNEPLYDFPQPPPAIQPLFQPSTDGKPIDTPASVYTTLQQMGYKGFRQGQEQAIMRILSGLSTLVVLSTGAGKSLIYQLASVMYMYSQRAPCITLVISPLVALMDDQVLGLPDCLKGVRLHSNMTKPQREKVVKDIQSGGVNILLVSPEAIVGGGGRGGGCMPSFDLLPPIAFACIDEVHCLSEWSHNFRPSYLMLCKVLRDRLGVKCLLGLTATATMATAQSVAQHLGIKDQEAIIRGTCLPDNLLLSSSRDCNRERALIELLKSPRFCHLPSIIIYCIRREDTERVASLLRTGLPEDLLESNPSENKEEDIVMIKDIKSHQEEITVIREMDGEPFIQDTQETRQTTNDNKQQSINQQMNNDKERQTYNNNSNYSVSLTDDKNQPQSKKITSRKSRKRKATDNSQEDKTDGNKIAATGKKRRKQTSEADDVYTYTKEDDFSERGL